MRRLARAVSFAALLCASCSWSAFTSLEHDPPAFSFSNQLVAGLVAVSPNPNDESATLATSAPAQGVRLFAVGNGAADPNDEPLNPSLYCEHASNALCMTATTIAGVGNVVDRQGVSHVGCFAVGYGTAAGASHDGPVVVCSDEVVVVLDAPTDVPALAKIAQGATATLSIGSWSGAPGAAPIVVGDPGDAKALYYASIATVQSEIVEVAAPNGEGDFGSAVAAGASLFAIGAPTAGKVYVFDPKGTPQGCIDVGPGGGDAIAIGFVDTVPTVVVHRGDGTVASYASAALTADCSTPAAATFACAETRGASGCASSRFGASIAIGDLDGDAASEIAIGAPGAAAEANGGSGVVFLFTPSRGTDVKDVRYLGDPTGGEGFGASIAIAPIGGLDTLVVAAPGASSAYVEWCPNLPATPASPRCRK